MLTEAAPLPPPAVLEATIAVAVAASGPGRPTSVVVDDASVLLVHGWSPAAVLAFLAACERHAASTGVRPRLRLGLGLRLCVYLRREWSSDLWERTQGGLLVRMPADADLAEDGVGAVVRALAHRAALRLELRPLPTGYSRDVDGDLAIVPWQGPAERLHYKATEVGLRFVGHGLARGTL
jgi:hypothetical protein